MLEGQQNAYWKVSPNLVRKSRYVMRVATYHIQNVIEAEAEKKEQYFFHIWISWRELGLNKIPVTVCHGSSLNEEVDDTSLVIVQTGQASSSLRISKWTLKFLRVHWQTAPVLRPVTGQGYREFMTKHKPITNTTPWAFLPRNKKTYHYKTTKISS